MRVFNLTDKVISFKGKNLLPYDSLEIPMSFIPDRDMLLQKAGKLAFGALPKGWKKPEAKAASPALVPAPKLRIGHPIEEKKEVPEVTLAPEPVKEEAKEEKFEGKKQEFSKKKQSWG